MTDIRALQAPLKDAPVGFTSIRLTIDLDADASSDLLAKLSQLTERYCVVYQTLRASSELSIEVRNGSGV